VLIMLYVESVDRFLLPMPNANDNDNDNDINLRPRDLLKGIWTC
jgi:hypothetical protein